MNSIVLGSPLISGVVATLIVLVVGDFASTFFYHVPQHMWGKLHLRTHHDRKRSYWDHAVLSRNPAVLLDGLLGALPYIAIAVACATLSVAGAIVGLGARAAARLVAAYLRARLEEPGVARARCPRDGPGSAGRPQRAPRQPRNRVRRHLPLLRRSRRATRSRGCARSRLGAAAPWPCALMRARNRRSATALRALKQRKSPTG